MQGSEYTHDTVPPEPAITKDGRNTERGVVSIEDAAKIDAVVAGAETEQPVTVEQPAVDQPPVDEPESTDEPATVDEPAPSDEPVTKPDSEPVTVNEEESTITVGGVTKPVDQWLQEMYREIPGAIALSPEEQSRVLDGWINTRHKKAWQKNLTQSSQEAAEQKREIEKKAAEIRARQQQVNEERRKVKAEAERLEKRKNELEKIASMDVKPSDDGVESDEERYQKFRKRQAQDELNSIKDQESQLQQQSAQFDADGVLLEVSLFQTQHPEYATGEEFVRVAHQVRQEGKFDHPDVHRVLDVLDIIEYASERQIPMELAYQQLQKSGKLAVKSEGKPLPTSIKRSSDAKRMAAELAKRQLNGTQFLDGKPAPRPTVGGPAVPLGDKIHAAGQRARGAGAPTDALLNWENQKVI